MALPPYTYGSMNLNDGTNYIVSEKPFDLPDFQQTTFKIARQEGVKKTGESVGPRQIAMKVWVIGSSRADLESKLSALNSALNLRQQQLRIFSFDTRYFIADAISSKPVLVSGKPITVEVPIVFICQQPYAYSPTVSTFDTGVLTLTGSGTTWNFPVQTIAGGGNFVTKPQIRVFQSGTALAWTGITISQQTDGMIINVTTGLPSANGDYLDFFCDNVLSINGWTVQKNSSGTNLAFGGQFPVLEPNNTAFLITVNAPSAPNARAVFTWTPRWLP